MFFLLQFLTLKSGDRCNTISSINSLYSVSLVRPQNSIQLRLNWLLGKLNATPSAFLPSVTVAEISWLTLIIHTVLALRDADLRQHKPEGKNHYQQLAIIPQLDCTSLRSTQNAFKRAIISFLCQLLVSQVFDQKEDLEALLYCYVAFSTCILK